MTKFRPILFSTPMVHALLNGTKTQTRRIVKLPSYHLSKLAKQAEKMNIIDGNVYFGTGEKVGTLRFPCAVGDVLWVRETFYKTEATELNGAFYYKTNTDVGWDLKWKPSLFMPKDACRLFLKVKAIRVERLNDICEDDAINEGIVKDELFGYKCYECDKSGHIAASNLCVDGFYSSAIKSFRSLWKLINGNGSWNKNPFVFVYEFERIEKPLDFK